MFGLFNDEELFDKDGRVESYFKYLLSCNVDFNKALELYKLKPEIIHEISLINPEVLSLYDNETIVELYGIVDFCGILSNIKRNVKINKGKKLIRKILKMVK